MKLWKDVHFRNLSAYAYVKKILTESIALRD